MNIPRKLSKWKHRSEKVYQVLCVTNIKATKPDYPVTVVYEDCEGNIWSRPLAGWYDSMTEIV